MQVTAPTSLSSAELAVWDRLAPSALRMGTLTPETVPGFILLVQTMMARDEAAAVLARDGLVVNRTVHQVSTHVRQMTQRLESLLSRFSLLPTGRPVERPRPARVDDVDEWESGHDFYGVVRKPQPTRERGMSRPTA
ncbi:P27 family phage terminase small subunit [Luteitalea pratensis]|uniref:P27 family phage terminase small subunit n=1 Tax=Luteitalea pratensis TaxID=1855912 RepID=UPI000D72BF2C|nr:P27 family phage terminase small subunit [Luteitalea pratensis]